MRGRKELRDGKHKKDSVVKRTHVVYLRVFSGEETTTLTTCVYSLGSLKQRRMDSNRLLFNTIIIVIIVVWFIYCVFVIL